jgi:hypothetical protein
VSLLQIDGLRGPHAPQVVPVVLANFPKCIVGTGWAVAVACIAPAGRRFRCLFPRVLFSDSLTYTTLNYHIVPAFLHIRHAALKEAFIVPKSIEALGVDLNPCVSLH